MVLNIKFLVPLYPAGQEPPPPGISEEEIPGWEQQKKMEKYMSLASESCIFKSTLAGGMGEFFIGHEIYLNNFLHDRFWNGCILLDDVF
jgi:hypothetical protein